MKWRRLSLKRKFYLLIGGITGLMLGMILLLYFYANALLGQAQTILADNEQSLLFEAAVAAERSSLELWANGGSGEAETALREAAEQTRLSVEALPDELARLGLDRFQDTWAIKNSYRAYTGARDRLLALPRGDAGFSALLYRVYEMQDYLERYGSRLTQTVMREGDVSYQAARRGFAFLPVLLVLEAFVLVLAIARTGRSMDEIFVEPVVALSEDAARIGRNDFGGALPKARDEDEMGALIAAFGQMKRSTADFIEALEKNNELRLQLEKVQLRMLRNQINPHFLFNTLNTISCMAQLEDAEVTDRMILALSRLFQYALRSSDTVTPLANELRVVEDYLYLQKMRFEDRLQYEVTAEPGTQSRMVPSYILQPLAENAVIHGIGPREEGGKVAIRSWTEGRRLWLCVEDNGVGMNQIAMEAAGEEKSAGEPSAGGQETQILREDDGDASKEQRGIGLDNIRKRVKLLYEDGVFQVESSPGQGTRVTIGFTDRTEEETATIQACHS